MNSTPRSEPAGPVAAAAVPADAAGHPSDPSGIAWVHDELRRSLESAHKLLRRYLRESEANAGSDVSARELGALRQAHSLIHQSAGAANLVGSPAASRVLDASDAALRWAMQRLSRVDAALVDKIERASFAVIDWLGRSKSGRPVSALYLFPQMRALLEVAGADRVHPADLWFRDWQWQTLRFDDEVTPRPLDARSLSALEQLTLAQIKTPSPLILARIGDFFAGVAAANRQQATPQQTALWQLAAAVFDALARGELREDVFNKRLASRLLSLLRALLRGQPASDETTQRLAHDLLFFCAQARPDHDGSPRLAAVRQAYGLQHEPAVDYSASPLGRVDPALSNQARKRLQTARQAWSAAAAGDAQQVAGLAESFSLVADSLHRLFTDGEALAGQLEAVAARQQSATEPPDSALAMEVAIALLYLDAALDEGEPAPPDDDADRPLDRLARRIEAARSGGLAQPLEPWVERLYRRAAERQTQATVVHELRVSMTAAEQLLDRFFRDAGDREALAPAAALLHSMRGVTMALGVDDATQALQAMRLQVDAIAADPAPPVADALDQLASNIGTLGFLVDMLNVQPELARRLFRFDAGSGRLLSVGGPQPPIAAAPAAAGADDRMPERAAVGAAPVAAGGDAPRPAFDVLPTTPAFGTEVEHATFLEPSPAPVVEPATATTVRADPEIEAIFVDEAAELLDAARRQLLEWTGGRALQTAPGELRRIFHTLKGSARMVGRLDVGELAWDAEQRYHARQRDEPAADDAAADARAQADMRLREWTSWTIERLASALGSAPTAAPPAPAESLPDFDRGLLLPDEPARTDPLAPLDIDVTLPDGLDLDLSWNEAIPAQAPRRADDGDSLRLGAGFFDLTLPPPGRDDAPPGFPPDLPSAHDLELDFDLSPLPEPAGGQWHDSLRAPLAAPRVAREIDVENVGRLPDHPPMQMPDLSFITLDLSEPTGDAAAGAAADPWTPSGTVQPAPQPPIEDAMAPAQSTGPMPAADDPQPAVFGPPSAPSPASEETPSAPPQAWDETPPAQQPQTSDATLSEPQPQAWDETPPPPQPQAWDETPSPAHPQAGDPTPRPSELPAWDEPPPAPQPQAADDFLTSPQAPAPDDTPTALPPFPWRDVPTTAAPQAEDEMPAQPAWDEAPLPPLTGDELPPAPLPSVAEEAPSTAPPISGDGWREPPLVRDEAPQAPPSAASDEARSAPPPIPDDTAPVTQPPTWQLPPPLPWNDAASPDVPSAADPPLTGWTETPPAGPAPLPPAEEAPRSIGPLQVPAALFNAFIGEADDLSRLLCSDLASAAMQHDAAPPAAAFDRVHALVDRSATVGFAGLGELAGRLEAALQLQQRIAGSGAGFDAADALLFSDAAEEIRQLLHQFAAGFLRAPTPDLLQRLADFADRARQRLDRDALAQAAPAPVMPPVTPPAPPGDWLADISADDQVEAELFPIFEEEADDLLPQLAAALRDWARQPERIDAAQAAMRHLHTFKGGARLAGAMRLGELAHRLETRIEQLAADPAAAAGGAIDSLLAGSDALGQAFDSIREDHARRPVSEARPPAVPIAVDAAAQAPAMALSPIDWSRFGAAAAPAAAPVRAAGAAVPGSVRVRAALLDRMVNQAGEVNMSRARIELEMGQVRTAMGELADNIERLRQQLHDIELQAELQMSSRSESARAAAQPFDALEIDRFTRLQELTRMMAESVNDVATVQRSLKRNLQRTEDELAAQTRLTRDLQSDLLRTRLVQFEMLAERLHRVVRQAAAECGKQAELQIAGGDIELDRSVLDRLTPVLEHLLRNAVIHGVEAPEQRGWAGKPAVGTVRIELHQHGNHVGIDVVDDGAGLDLARIRARAEAMGQWLAAGREVEMIFAPGFSTAEQLTEMAGRGVGLDVVRNELAALEGQIEVSSSPGAGCRFSMLLPLTTATTQVLMLRCGDSSVAVPATMVEQVRRISEQDLAAALADGFYLYGYYHLPMYWLGPLLGYPAAAAATFEHGRPLVIAHNGRMRLAIFVDEVLGQQEAVIRHLGPQLSRLPGLAGMSMLASGSVALIYNPFTLVAEYGHLAGPASAAPVPAAPAAAPAAPLVLVVDDSLTVRRVTERLLKREGFRVELAKDGLEALERIAAERPGVVLSDIEMPRMDGYQLVERLRADAETRSLPVVMITSRIAERHRVVAESLGVARYLGKPYREDELLSAVAEALAGAPPANR